MQQLAEMLQQFKPATGEREKKGKPSGRGTGTAPAAFPEAFRFPGHDESGPRSSGTADGRVVSTEIAGMDRLLPAGGLRAGVLMEWLAGGAGSGAGTLAFSAVRPWLQAARRAELPGICVLLETGAAFYPPAIAGLGIPLEHLVLIRPPSLQEALWAAEQSLRCPGVSVVAMHLGRCRDRVLQRLQLAAETGGGIGLLFRSREARKQRAWAEVRLGVTPVPMESAGAGRRLRVERLYGRGCLEPQAIEFEIHDETGAVSVVSQLADSALAARRLRA